MSDFRFVDLTRDDATNLIPNGTERIGIDTEFMRERTYFAQLCLVQLSTAAGIVCADPLGTPPGDSPPDDFWDALMAPEWVLHAGRQDIEVIHQASGRMPAALFDTQVAAALLGMQPQIGYAGLVKSLFDIELDKSHTRADWSRRPLSDAFLRYAAEDVEYLLPARDALVKSLEEGGRLEWAIEDSKALLSPSLYSIDPAQAVDRLKAARNLRGRTRAAAVALATWREKEALRRDRPRQWIMRDPVLIDIAQTAPTSKSQLARIDGLPDKTIQRFGDRLTAIVAESTHDASGYRPPKRPDEQQKAALKEMQRRVAKIGEELGIAAEVLAPRKDLSAAMLGERDGRIFRGWRAALFGDELRDVLECCQET
jgi:ribonuclease D